MTVNKLSRRGILGAMAAAFATAPALAASVSTDTANTLWAERQAHIGRLRELNIRYDAAHEKLPAWLRDGPAHLDKDGNLCGPQSGWPMDTSVVPPPIGYRIIRPTPADCRWQFDFEVRVFATNAKGRAISRARMRETMRGIIARLREQKRLYQELGIAALQEQIAAACDDINAAANTIATLPASPNATAARLLASLDDNCTLDACAEGAGFCGTMAVALMLLRDALPNLSGLIHEHAAFFVSNPTLALNAMPFQPA